MNFVGPGQEPSVEGSDGSLLSGHSLAAALDTQRPLRPVGHTPVAVPDVITGHMDMLLVRARIELAGWNRNEG